MNQTSRAKSQTIPGNGTPSRQSRTRNTSVYRNATRETIPSTGTWRHISFWSMTSAQRHSSASFQPSTHGWQPAGPSQDSSRTNPHCKTDNPSTCRIAETRQNNTPHPPKRNAWQGQQSSSLPRFVFCATLTGQPMTARGSAYAGTSCIPLELPGAPALQSIVNQVFSLVHANPPDHHAHGWQCNRTHALTCESSNPKSTECTAIASHFAANATHFPCRLPLSQRHASFE